MEGIVFVMEFYFSYFENLKKFMQFRKCFDWWRYDMQSHKRDVNIKHYINIDIDIFFASLQIVSSSIEKLPKLCEPC